jgi:hypothetical protein
MPKVKVETRLREAKLRGANLRGANLHGAQEWTEDQLHSSESLEGATMPNGQKYEDWIKNKEGHQEGGETSVTS